MCCVSLTTPVQFLDPNERGGTNSPKLSSDFHTRCGTCMPIQEGVHTYTIHNDNDNNKKANINVFSNRYSLNQDRKI